MFYDPLGTNMGLAMGSIYSYRSLMAFHLLKETPMGIKNAYRFLQYMMPAFTILGLFHSEHGGNTKYLSLKKDSNQLPGDLLEINYELTADENARVADNESRFASALRKLNCFVIKKINPGHGAGIHYAGTLPFSDSNEKFRILPSSRLGDTKQVYIADGSGFNYLPAKGLTFSLMANAHVAAENALAG